MVDTATKRVIEAGIDGLDDMLGNGERIDPSELHNRLYNQDYFIIGSYDAEHFLADYGIFAAIDEIKDYEQNNFGEVNTDLSDAEKVANMFAYIKGEEALNDCATLQKQWGEGELSEDDLMAIKAELEEQI